MIRYENAAANDLPAIARLYQIAFPEALNAVFGEGRLPSIAINDAFLGIYRHEPSGFIVARDGEHLVGYLMVCSNRDSLWKNLVRGGTVRRMVLGWIAGRYKGLGMAFVPRLAKLGWNYWRAEKKPEVSDPAMAQVLSIVVDFAYKRRGIGRQMTQKALDYLRTTAAQSVRLEVDAAKEAPVQLYKQVGFKEIARLTTPRGPALVMTLALK